MTSPGIDYSRGTANFDPETGVHYGIISNHAIDNQRWCDESESVYAAPTCPECGTELPPTEAAEALMCTTCDIQYTDADELWPEDPKGFRYEANGYALWQSHDDSDIWVFKSPYITIAPFCSPCAPGAGSLESAMDESDDWEALEAEGWPRVYALGPEWFEGDVTPYALLDA